MLISSRSFDNTFNIVTEDISKIEIVENPAKNNCFIKEKNSSDRYYNKFILVDGSRVKILCEVSFYQSSVTSKYLPRLSFKKVNKNLDQISVDAKKDINISFNGSEESLALWKLIAFLNKFKQLVDLGEFENSFKVLPKDIDFIEFESTLEKEKTEDLIELIKKANLSEKALKELLHENRKKNLKAFLYFLKQKKLNKNNTEAIEAYKNKFINEIKGTGNESVWHHFLKANDWILGLNVDIKFIKDFESEVEVGIGNSLGSENPKVDLVGISDFTTLIELKTHDTRIFKENKTSKSRANTWDFSTDFIEGISQALGQKFPFEIYYDQKTVVNRSSGERLDKTRYKTLDTMVVFIIGNRKKEFPHNNINDNHIKSETFERFRRNSKNVNIITFDELFERAYHVVFSEKIPDNWFSDPAFDIH